MFAIVAAPAGSLSLRARHPIAAVGPTLMFCCFLAVCLPGRAAAQWTVNGVAVAATDSEQVTPRIVSDGAGGAIVVWEDGRSGDHHAFASRLTGSGTIAGSWPAAGAPLPNRGFAERNLTAVADGSGGAFVASDDGNFTGAVMVHHLGPDGLPASGWPSSVIELQRAPFGRPGGNQGAFLAALLPDASGGVFVSRTYRDRFNQSITLTRLSASSGFAPGWSAGTFAGAGPGLAWEYPSLVCSDAAGGVIVAFQQADNNLGKGTYIERYDEAGAAVFTGVLASATSSGQTGPGLVSDGTGGAIVVWEDHRNGVFDQLIGQHVLADGSLAPGWPVTGITICAHPTAPGTVSDFIFPGSRSSVEPDGSGGLYVAWSDYRDSAGTGAGDIYAQHLLGNGTIAPGWPVNGLAICVVGGDQRAPVVARDGQGGILVAWQDSRNGSYDIYAQRLDAAGNASPNWPSAGLAVCTASGNQQTPQLVGDGAAGAILAWVDGRGGRTQIYAARVAFDAVVPAVASLVSADVLDDFVHLVWYAGSSKAVMITIARRVESDGWTPIASILPEGDGRIVYVDRDVRPGRRYGYRLGLGAGQYAGEVFVDFPRALSFALESPQPNPSPGPVSAAFTLPDAAAAYLDLIDVAGRRSFTRAVGSLGAGRHVLTLDPEAKLAPGVYLVRLVRGQTSRTRRLLIAH